jgi:hypothetical protein
MLELNQNEILNISGGGCGCFCTPSDGFSQVYKGIVNDAQVCLSLCSQSGLNFYQCN